MTLTSASANSSEPSGDSDRMFLTTRWTMVSMASGPQTTDQLQALEYLCESYRPAIMAFLRQSGKRPEDAEDLTQQFFLQLLTKDTLRHANAGRGKFRTFLLTCVRNFVRNEYQRDTAYKRGGGMVFEQLEDVDPSAEASGPDQAFDQKWAETMIGQALKRLEKEWERDGKPFSQLRCYLVDPKGEVSFAKKAAELEISEAALKSSVYRLRQRYGFLVRELVAETVASHEAVEEELQSLLAILAGA